MVKFRPAGAFFDRTLFILAAMAAVSGAACYLFRGSDVFFETFADDARSFVDIAPKMAGALLLAAYIQILVPRDVVARYLGDKAGVKGVALATGIGAVTPGGPMTSYPVVGALYQAGTGRAALVAYLTAWSTLGFQRILIWEVPLLGMEFAIMRELASIPLAFLAAMISGLFPASIKRKENRVSGGTIFLFLLAFVAAWFAHRRDESLLKQGAGMAAWRFVEVLPRMGLALLTAGFVGQLVPTDPVARLIGAESGLFGILVASAVGGFIPSGPMVSFPVLVVLVQAGAGFPQTCAFVTAWSVLALHRVLIFEIALMGWHFTMVRLASSIILPPVCGLLAEILIQIHPIKGRRGERKRRPGGRRPFA